MTLATLDWSDVFNAVDINKAVEVLEEKILAVHALKVHAHVIATQFGCPH